jgi:hypothetical protein
MYALVYTHIHVYTQPEIPKEEFPGKLPTTWNLGWFPLKWVWNYKHHRANDMWHRTPRKRNASAWIMFLLVNVWRWYTHNTMKLCSVFVAIFLPSPQIQGNADLKPKELFTISRYIYM